MEDHLRRFTLNVQGVHCASCVSKIKRELDNLEGLEHPLFLPGRYEQLIFYSSDEGIVERVKERLRAIGFPPLAEETERPSILFHLAIAGFFAMWVMLGSFAQYFSPATEFPADFERVLALLSVLGVIGGGAPIFRGFFRELKSFRPGMDTLISLAVAASLILSFYLLGKGEKGYFDTAVALIVFLLMGRYLEEIASFKLSDGIQKLCQHSPSLVRLEDDSIVPVEQVDVGTVVKVRSSETIPVDGVVVTGRSTADKSFFSGESLPQEIFPGMRVFAGSKNLGTEVSIETTGTFGHREIDAISELLEQLLASESSYRRQADLIASWLTPFVLLLALTSGLAILFGQGPLDEALLRAVTVLLITCPCALGLAVPAGLTSGLSMATKKGVRFYELSSIERAAKIDTIVFDKTGTLTTGQLAITETRLAHGVDRSVALEKAAQVSWGSSHPIGELFLRLANLKKVWPGERVVSHGDGVVFDELCLGRRSFLLAQGVCNVPEEEEGTQVHLAVRHEWQASFYFSDEIKPDSLSLLLGLKSKGYKVGLLSGDSLPQCEIFAKQFEIELLGAEKKPVEKAKIVAGLQKEGFRVAFVGDGLNDGPVLAQADLGIAVASATQLAKGSADVAISSPSLSRVSTVFDIARRTTALVKQNLAWAFLYNLVALPLAASGYVTPTLAAVAMVLSSLSVTLNSLRGLSPSLPWSEIACQGSTRPTRKQ